MKLLVMHDKNGNITSVGMPGSEFAGEMSLIPEAGQQVTEVEVSGVTHKTLDEKNLQNLVDIVEHYQIKLVDDRPKLVRKVK